MHIYLIRNATLRLKYAQKQLVIDPYLAAKHSRPSFTGASPNPLVDLPCSPEAVIAGAEKVLVSHLHSDHFDPAAQALLPKATPLVCQPQDQAQIEALGFTRVTALDETMEWDGLRITRTPCQHGSGAVLQEMGNASGFVFQAVGEPTLYWVGDSIWYDGVAQVIAQYRPDVIVTHSCGAMWGEQVLIVMDAEQTVAVCRAAPRSTVVAVHMEALDHATVTRQALRRHVAANGVGPQQLRIPLDGDMLSFPQ